MQEINGRKIFLDSDVEEEVTKDINLYILWRATQPSYDWEIDPLHQIWYVAEQRKLQKEALLRLKSNIKKFESEFKEIEIYNKNAAAKASSL